MPTLSQHAAARGQALFGCDEYERVADILADLIHYCLAEGEDFEAELDTARQYVTEEQGADIDIA